jgi:hypothetical protein
MIVPLVLTLALGASDKLVITSDSDCPDRAAIAAAVEPLIDPAGVAGGTVAVQATPSQLIVELAGSGGDPQRRVLASAGDCRARARAVAVVVASWLGGAPAGGAVSAPRISSAPRERRSVSAPVALATSDAAVGPRRFSLGLGVLGALDGQGSQAGLHVEAALDRPRGPWIATLGLVAAPARDLSVGQGRARWMRPRALLGVAVPLVDGAVRIALGGGPTVGVLRVEGHDFDVDRTESTLSFGAHTGLRAGARFGPVELWADLRAHVWPVRQQIVNQRESPDEPARAALPTWEAHLTLGASVQLF